VTRSVDPLGLILGEQTSSLDRWAAAAAEAAEACLVINELYEIYAVSPAGAVLLGYDQPADLLRCNLLAGAVRLVDFNNKPQPLPAGDVEKTPPVLAIDTTRLARGLMRVQADRLITLDAIAAPLLDDGKAIGSLTFFVEI
jgi:hypothetical protein